MTFKKLFITQIIIMLVLVISWSINLYRLIQCDFDSKTSWKPEIVHAIGIIPVVSLFTMWYEVG